MNLERGHLVNTIVELVFYGMLMLEMLMECCLQLVLKCIAFDLQMIWARVVAELLF